MDFTAHEIRDMNLQYPWNGTIRNDNDTSYNANKDAKETFKLHATGNVDLNGRQYVYLPSSLKITDEIKKEHNLM